MNTNHQTKKAPTTVLLKTGRVLTVLLVLSFFAYFFLLIQTVQAVGDRKELRTETEELQSTIASLEITYYEKVHSFGLSTLEEYGYQSIQPRFIMADGTSVQDSLARVQ